MSAPEIIKNKILSEGPIPFNDFMDIALYDPSYGYYRADVERTGKTGDYYTSPGFTPLFGEMIAKQIEEMWAVLGKNDFSIVEFGGNKGSLCHDILERLQENTGLYKGLHYYIIDRTVSGQTKRPFEHHKVSWLQSPADLKEIQGCILSNELLDNFPIHIVTMRDRLYEIFVDYSDNHFQEITRKDEGKLQAYLSELNVILPPGFRTEINLQALSWLQEITRILKRGFVLTIDYGFRNDELYDYARREGTLVCYYKHNINFDPYIHIGEQDITSHVNFSALYYWGLKNQLEYAGLTTQSYFFRALGIAEHVKKMEEKGRSYSHNANETLNMAYRFLLQMGSKLKVFVQQKGIKNTRLSGLKFSSSSWQENCSR